MAQGQNRGRSEVLRLQLSACTGRRGELSVHLTVAAHDHASVENNAYSVYLCCCRIVSTSCRTINQSLSWSSFLTQAQRHRWVSPIKVLASATPSSQVIASQSSPRASWDSSVSAGAEEAQSRRHRHIHVTLFQPQPCRFTDIES